MQTTAVYNKEDDTITINTPTELAHKYWITNGALHAQHCVVFAQLQVDGEWHGVHAILCQIRDGVAGQTMPGVTINDMGHRMGLNGVDNALLSFDNVKVPRTNLLNKYSDISEDGKFRKLLQMSATKHNTCFINVPGRKLLLGLEALGLPSNIAVFCTVFFSARIRHPQSMKM